MNFAVDHILQEFYILFLTRVRTYKIASPPQTKMASKADIKGLVSLKFLGPWSERKRLRGGVTNDRSSRWRLFTWNTPQIRPANIVGLQAMNIDWTSGRGLSTSVPLSGHCTFLGAEGRGGLGEHSTAM